MLREAQELADSVRELRKSHGISQGELAQIAGVSLPSISRFERGKDTIRLDVLMKILGALGYRLEIKTKGQQPASKEAGMKKGD